MSVPAGAQPGYPLARLTTIGTGGPARWFAQPATLPDLRELLEWAGAEGIDVAVVGLGSNLLIADEGYDGLVLQLAGELAAIEVGESSAICGGGASLAAVVRRTRDAGLSGIEFGCAIPGTVGGAVRMNAGAYGGELRDVLADATVVSAAGERRGGPDELEHAIPPFERRVPARSWLARGSRLCPRLSSASARRSGGCRGAAARASRARRAHSGPFSRTRPTARERAP